jgi:hypothetical protein
MKMKKIETIKNEASGIIYFPIFGKIKTKMHPLGLHFFLDEFLELLCCPSLASGEPDVDNMEQVDELYPTLTKSQETKMNKIAHRLYVRIEESQEGN